MGNEHKIQWITVRKTEGDEWKTFFKTVKIQKNIEKAVARFQSDSVCGLFINDKFVSSGTGHYYERVNAHNVTDLFVEGVNTLCIKLGTRYYQATGIDVKNRTGHWYSNFAFELEIVFEDGSIEYVSSDSSWEAKKEFGIEGQTYDIANVTAQQYKDNWESAAVWEEQVCDIPIERTVLDVVGDEYKKYSKNAPVPNVIYPVSIYATNMTEDELSCNGLSFETRGRHSGEDRYVIFEFEHIVVGFTEIEFEVEEEAELSQYVEWAEKASELDKPVSEYSGVITRLSTSQTINTEEKSKLNLYRRAFRFVKIVISNTDKPIKINNFFLRPCLYPVNRVGWFSCEDEMLNDIWEVGRYTLHINKQQEYESCPRNEMKYFSGDGIIAALTDYYAFGDSALVNASLGLNYPSSSAGKVLDFSLATSSGLWDYPAWWIVTLYNEYKFNADINFLKRYYNNAVMNIEWYISLMNDRDLIYNLQRLRLPFHIEPSGIEWTDSGYRTGEKTSLNALFYKALMCMVELSDAINDDKAERWRRIAENVKKAINNYLWSEETQAYIDKEHEYIPQDGNAFATLFDVADSERANKVFDTMRKKLWSDYGSAICDIPLEHSRGGTKTIAPLICTYEAEANFLHGNSEHGIDLIKRCWGSMLKKGAKSFWEYTPNDSGEWTVRSHAWSAGCTYLLSAYVLGIRPLKYGWNKIIFEPQPGNIKCFKGVVPTALGDIAVKYEGNHYVLAVPEIIDIETNVDASHIEIIKY